MKDIKNILFTFFSITVFGSGTVSCSSEDVLPKELELVEEIGVKPGVVDFNVLDLSSFSADKIVSIYIEDANGVFYNFGLQGL